MFEARDIGGSGKGLLDGKQLGFDGHINRDVVENLPTRKDTIKLCRLTTGKTYKSWFCVALGRAAVDSRLMYSVFRSQDTLAPLTIAVEAPAELSSMNASRGSIGGASIASTEAPRSASQE